MWETIKKDPLIKTIVVLLIGVIAFGFAFNIMFGSGGNAMGEGMMSTGYSLGNALEIMIALLIKLSVIVLLTGVIVWVIQAIRRNSVSNQSDQFAWLKEDPVIKYALIIIGVVMVSVFVVYAVRGNPSVRYSESDMMGSSYSIANNMSYGIQSLLTLFIKFLMVLSVMGLGFGIFMYIRKNDKNNSTLNGRNEAIDNSVTSCPECKTKLKAGWKCCPYCGNEKVTESGQFGS